MGNNKIKFICLLAFLLVVPSAMAFICEFDGIALLNGKMVRHDWVSVYNDNGFLATGKKGDFFGNYQVNITPDDLPIYFTIRSTLADSYRVDDCYPGKNKFNVVVTDKDNDGFGIVEDCNDNDPNVFPLMSPKDKGSFVKNCDGKAGDVNCMSLWSCTTWGQCSPEGIKERYCRDLNNCQTPQEKPEDRAGCTYNPEDSANALVTLKTPLEEKEANMITGDVIIDTNSGTSPSKDGSFIFLKNIFAALIITIVGVTLYVVAFKRR